MHVRVDTRFSIMVHGGGERCIRKLFLTGCYEVVDKGFEKVSRVRANITLSNKCVFPPDFYIREVGPNFR